MERVTDSVIEAVKARMDIVEVISDFVQLKPSGKSRVGLSPFKDEKTPSFTVDPQRQTFNDFSSGIKGDLITFIQQHEKLTFLEAIAWLAKRYNIPLESTKPTKEEIQAREIRNINKKALNFFRANFPNSIAYDYMILRGFTDQTLEKFRIGYSPKDWTALTDHFKQSKQDMDFAANTAYVICHDPKKRRYFDRFRNRVIFPWINEEDKIIAFGGRTLEEEEKLTSQMETKPSVETQAATTPVRKNPKYLNSPQTAIFSKQYTFYGLHLAAKAIRKTATAYIVEGYTDVMGLNQVGVENVLASAGTAFTKGHARYLKKLGAEKVVLFFDPDQAGRSATERGIDILLGEGLSVKIVTVEQTGDIKLDPAEFAIANTPEYVQTYLAKQEHDFVMFMANERFKDRKHMDPDQKVAATKEILWMISALKDTMLVESYLKECAKIVDMSMEAMRGPLNEMIKERLEVEKKEKEAKEAKKNKPNNELSAQLVTFLLSPTNTRLANGMTPVEFLMVQLRDSDAHIQDPRITEILLALMEKGTYTNITPNLLINATTGQTRKLVEDQVGGKVTLTDLVKIRLTKDVDQGLYKAFARMRYLYIYGVALGMQKKLASMSEGEEKTKYQERVDWLMKAHSTMGEAMTQLGIALPAIPSTSPKMV
jgi:DNA primase